MKRRRAHFPSESARERRLAEKAVRMLRPKTYVITFDVAECISETFLHIVHNFKLATGAVQRLTSAIKIAAPRFGNATTLIVGTDRKVPWSVESSPEAEDGYGRVEVRRGVAADTANVEGDADGHARAELIPKQFEPGRLDSVIVYKHEKV